MLLYFWFIEKAVLIRVTPETDGNSAGEEERKEAARYPPYPNPMNL